MAGKDLNVKRLLEMTADINAVDNVTLLLSARKYSQFGN